MSVAKKTPALAFVAALVTAGCADVGEQLSSVENDVEALSNRDSGYTVDQEDRRAEYEWRRGYRRSLRPLLECVERLPDGKLRAHWGYSNPSKQAVRRKVGSRNTFSPRPADRGQPTRFQPGTAHEVFTTTFNANRTLVWTLEGMKVGAHAGSKQCGGTGGAAGAASGAGTGGVVTGGTGGVVTGGSGGVVTGGTGGVVTGGTGGVVTGGTGGVVSGGAGGSVSGGTGGSVTGGTGGVVTGGAGGSVSGGTGGSVSGGTGGSVSGGTGGSVSGGTGGAGGAGGSGSSVPGGTAACNTCRATSCTDYQGLGFNVVNGCFSAIDPQFGASATDPTFIQECVALVSCAYTNKCGFNLTGAAECFCGTATIDNCFASAGAANGPCKALYEQAARSAVLNDVSLRTTDLAYPLGWANYLLECDTQLCGAACAPK